MFMRRSFNKSATGATASSVRIGSEVSPQRAAKASLDLVAKLGIPASAKSIDDELSGPDQAQRVLRSEPSRVAGSDPGRDVDMRLDVQGDFPLSGTQPPG